MVSTSHSGHGGGLLSSTLRVDILGIRISAVNMPQALDRLIRHIGDGRRGYVCVTDVNALLHARRDPELRRIFNASTMTVPDGVPLVWVARAQVLTGWAGCAGLT
ncbi:WecB/TagA/CpsF family glycosyltransferase [Pseudarthrobacter sp. So.54]